MIVRRSGTALVLGGPRVPDEEPWNSRVISCHARGMSTAAPIRTPNGSGHSDRHVRFSGNHDVHIPHNTRTRAAAEPDPPYVWISGPRRSPASRADGQTGSRTSPKASIL